MLIEDLNEIVGVGHRVVNGGNTLKIQLLLIKKIYKKSMNYKIMHHFITQQRVVVLKPL